MIDQGNSAVTNGALSFISGYPAAYQGSTKTKWKVLLASTPCSLNEHR